MEEGVEGTVAVEEAGGEVRVVEVAADGTDEVDGAESREDEDEDAGLVRTGTGEEVEMMGEEEAEGEAVEVPGVVRSEEVGEEVAGRRVVVMVEAVTVTELTIELTFEATVCRLSTTWSARAPAEMRHDSNKRALFWANMIEG